MVLWKEGNKRKNRLSYAVKGQVMKRCLGRKPVSCYCYCHHVQSEVHWFCIYLFIFIWQKTCPLKSALCRSWTFAAVSWNAHHRRARRRALKDLIERSRVSERKSKTKNNFNSISHPPCLLQNHNRYTLRVLPWLVYAFKSAGFITTHMTCL